MSALKQARLEGAYQEALERAGGDVERLARALMTTCIDLAGENEAMVNLIGSSKRKRTEPGAPKGKGNPLPRPTKEYGGVGLQIKRRYRGMNNRGAAVFTILDALNEAGTRVDDEGVWHRLIKNVQRRISEAEKRR